MDDELIRALSFTKASRYRRKVLESLDSAILTPSEIAKNIDTRLNHVSMYLKELKDEGLVVCLNEEAKKGRLYRLTALGEQVYGIVKRDI
ncbi:winged helix-turn-helix domain-containing protein [Methanoculleus sp. 7T]|jgi:predicted transcriptional regulator|uniref:winged helix-turn-helix domain-containing protein n=1 Tax=Methanoculleus sp. 7T TaxID=2937282 RepID=UPI0020BEA123|nr:winged helix-turn-helix domain-containing protein [Methanoculleus sp. 7T]MCK8519806.1 hypothetical protein [Methanoculleus sp. 7T]